MSTWTAEERDGDIVLECPGDSPRVIVRPRSRWDQGPLGLTTEAARAEARLLAADLALVLSGEAGQVLGRLVSLIGAEDVGALESHVTHILRELERLCRRNAVLEEAQRQIVELAGGRP